MELRARTGEPPVASSAQRVRWTPRSVAGRSREVLRESGPAALAWKVVGELGLRRLILFEGEPDAVSQPARPVPAAIELGELGSGEADRYLAFRPDSDPEEVMRRMAEGDRCHVARVEGRIVAARWVARREAWLPYLGVVMPLTEGDGYLYDAYTTPAWRRHGLSAAVTFHAVRRLRAEGCRRILRVALPENRAGLGLNRNLVPIATLFSIGSGRRRRHLRLPPPRRLPGRP